MLNRYFIGANNKTKKLEKDKILKIALNYYPDGFTFYKSTGYWKGGQEQAGILEIIDNSKAKTRKLALELKKELKQDAVLLQRLNLTASFI